MKGYRAIKAWQVRTKWHAAMIEADTAEEALAAGKGALLDKAKASGIVGDVDTIEVRLQPEEWIFVKETP